MNNETDKDDDSDELHTEIYKVAISHYNINPYAADS